MLILFCFVVKLDSPTKIPAKEYAFYAYMLVSDNQSTTDAYHMRRSFRFCCWLLLFYGWFFSVGWLWHVADER